ncbi:MAG: dihydroorotate dehydrogenase, partial [Actinomycetota bacterium]
LINTLSGMAIDVETGRPRLGGVTGGLSGPAIKPVAVRAIHDVHRAHPELPIIGMGGVRSVPDLVELIMAGASAVAVGTATFADPFATLELVEGLPDWLAERGYRSVRQLRGAVRV